MNKVEKSWNLEKIPDGTSRFFVKKVVGFHSISNKWNFQNTGKSAKKVRKKFEKSSKKS